MRSISCSQRLNRDLAELFSSDFNCTASHLCVYQVGDSLNEPGSIHLESQVFEGPYRGGRFNFCFNIPANYPFKQVEVWAVQPIWHPNIDLKTGKVAVPLEWSPVLTLHAFALAVQMLMLEPSAENPLNLDAYSYYISKPDDFDKHAQQSLHGGWICGVHFPSCLLSIDEMASANYVSAVKRSSDELNRVEEDRSGKRCRSSRYSIGEYDDVEEVDENQQDENMMVDYDDVPLVIEPSHRLKRRKLESASEDANNQISLAYSKLTLRPEDRENISPTLRFERPYEQKLHSMSP